MREQHQSGEHASTLVSGDLIESALRDFSSAGFMVDRQLVQRFVASLLTKRFVILTGLSGSGKTRLAQAFAVWLSAKSTEQPAVKRNADSMSTSEAWLPLGAELPSDRVYYRVDAIDSLAVELSNERGDGQRLKVTLPKGLIEEWVEAIRRNRYTRETRTRTIREEVARTTRYSTQLNSFETHLKAAAFALVEESERSWSLDRTQRLDDPERDQEAVNDEARQQVGGNPYAVIAVGADWNSSESILGYPDALHPRHYVRTPVLDLILRAESDPQSPHFLVLDEMNLSHVERYFADILSSIESGEPIHLYGDTDQLEQGTRDGVPSSIRLPQNLFIIGTVNIDETTYMFSPKVLDRANTIEFRVDESALEAFLSNPRTIQMESLRGRGSNYSAAFLEASKDRRALPRNEIQAKVNSELSMFFHVMSHHGYEFGFRTALEMSRFIRHFLDLGDTPPRLEHGDRLADLPESPTSSEWFASAPGTRAAFPLGSLPNRTRMGQFVDQRSPDLAKQGRNSKFRNIVWRVLATGCYFSYSRHSSGGTGHLSTFSCQTHTNDPVASSERFRQLRRGVDRNGFLP